MIIKNCPCINHIGIKNKLGKFENYYVCKHILDFRYCQQTNCLLKQIVEKCQEDKSLMAQSILEMFEIEECE